MGKKWVFFARYWIGFSLSRKVKGWRFLHDNNTPKHLGDRKPAHYESILMDVDRLEVDLDLLPDHRVKTYYLKLLPAPSSRLTCVSLWEGQLGIKLNETHVCKEIYGGLSTNWESDLAWRIVHGVVKTHAYLKSWRRLAVSKFCALRGQCETITHAFCECSHVSLVWAWLSTIIFKIHRSRFDLTHNIILLRDSLPGDCHAIINSLPF